MRGCREHVRGGLPSVVGARVAEGGACVTGGHRDLPWGRLRENSTVRTRGAICIGRTRAARGGVSTSGGGAVRWQGTPWRGADGGSVTGRQRRHVGQEQRNRDLSIINT